MLHLLHYYQSLKSIMIQKEENDSKTEQVMLNEKMALYRYLTNVVLRGFLIIRWRLAEAQIVECHLIRSGA